MKIILCFGTRPEAIKMAPLYHELKKHGIETKVCVTAQHREMLDQVLDFFEIVPDFDLNLMVENQGLNLLSANILFKIDELLESEIPDLVLVHGDTTTSSMVSIAAFHKKIKVGHVEAGLRTYNIESPFPEEFNRQLVTRIADLHFTPTKRATDNLLKENIKESSILQTGNTVIDSLFWTLDKLDAGFVTDEIISIKKKLYQGKKIVLVTGHRRENIGKGFEDLCSAIKTISKRKDVVIIFPVHLNPNVVEVVHRELSNIDNIHLIKPVAYPTFVWLMQQSDVIVTDSGGIQEEAPSLGKKVVVTRDVSERPEGIDEGFSIIVGTDKIMIYEAVNDILNLKSPIPKKANPYGDGLASKRISEYLLNKIKLNYK